jgi:hypothetical protein
VGQKVNTLYNSYSMDVESAYIIRIKGNNASEQLASRAAASCDAVGQRYKLWDAYDGTSSVISPPDPQYDTMSLIKIIDPYLTRTEVACALSHISLWVHCVMIDWPIVILEHDAVMVQSYSTHGVYNSIAYLGSVEQYAKGWDVCPTPPHGSRGKNFRFILRAHAYAIDPAVAKSLIAHVIQQGIYTSLDTIIRADLFPIHQMGLFAYDLAGETTIKNRPIEGERSMIKNDDLSI